MSHNPIICAIDNQDYDITNKLVASIHQSVGLLKFGLEFIISNGLHGVEKLMTPYEVPLFIDLKLYDIKNTVYKSINALAKYDMNIKFLSIHAHNGRDCIVAAQEIAYKLNIDLAVVTVLTSFDQSDLLYNGINSNILDYIVSIIEKNIAIGIKTFVVSPAELLYLRSKFDKDITLITPGIRLVDDSNDDQKRIMTPQEAISNGADYLVIGRSITNSISPKETIEEIRKNIL
ncbi:MAG: orotidine-5'-phosphate decarboxylase [Anaplasmataceae bacterium]|nr:orotidine-5'-phosphate decarboxylase [Anaplasmataceae bacterium]